MIRQDTDYALRLLLTLAEEPRGWETVAVLAGRADVPPPFAHKILRQLAAAGILRTRIGRHGGFMLERAPEEVSLLDVITAVQGPLQFSRCTQDPAVCSRQPSCRVHAKLRALQQQTTTVLADTPLSEMMPRPRPAKRRAIPRAPQTTGTAAAN